MRVFIETESIDSVIAGHEERLGVMDKERSIIQEEIRKGIINHDTVPRLSNVYDESLRERTSDFRGKRQLVIHNVPFVGSRRFSLPAKKYY